MAVSPRLCPLADHCTVIAGVGVDFPTHCLHPGNPENNFLEHQELSPLGLYREETASTLPTQIHDFSGNRGLG